MPEESVDVLRFQIESLTKQLHRLRDKTDDNRSSLDKLEGAAEQGDRTNSAVQKYLPVFAGIAGALISGLLWTGIQNNQSNIVTLSQSKTETRTKFVRVDARLGKLEAEKPTSLSGVNTTLENVNSRLINQQGQIHAIEQQTNYAFSNSNRIDQLLWFKVYKGQTLPDMKFFPSNTVQVGSDVDPITK